MAIRNNSKILIVGASGYIGKALLNKASSQFQMFGTSSSGSEKLLKLRLDSPNDFDYDIILPGDIVVLAAAISSPDICSMQHRYAWAVNVTGTLEFISKIISIGGRILFFSSDAVYGEAPEYFDESAKTHPVGDYAKMKMEVENSNFSAANFKSIRLSYVFSREDKFTKYLYESAVLGNEAELFHPFYRSVIHRDDVVDGVLAIARDWDTIPQGVINFGGPEVISRIEFAECLRKNVVPNLEFRVKNPGDNFFINRPKSIAMVSKILPKILGRSLRRLDDAIHIEYA